MTGRAWKKKVNLMVDSKDKEFVDVTQDPFETFRSAKHAESQVPEGNGLGSFLASDQNLETAVFEILG